MEMFRTLFKLQKRFIKSLGHKAPDIETFKEKSIATMIYNHSIMCELAELADEVDWKHWQSTTNLNSCTIKNIQMELADILCFWLNLCIIWGFDADSMFHAYKKKSGENFQRQTEGY